MEHETGNVRVVSSSPTLATTNNGSPLQVATKCLVCTRRHLGCLSYCAQFMSAGDVMFSPGHADDTGMSSQWGKVMSADCM